MPQIRQRYFKEHNYKAFHINGKTIRIALNPEEPITELLIPEFYDISVTSHCKGNCNFCYQDSLSSKKHDLTILDKFKSFFKDMSENDKPFQIAFGGGEPTSHPLFLDIIKECYDMGIVPNYTTNGMWSKSTKNIKNIIEYTKKYCGGVAVSTHDHLKQYWEKAVEYYLNENIFTNLHVIIGNKKSIDDFNEVYKKYHNKVKYFVLLPLTPIGRCKDAFNEWDYFCQTIDGNSPDIAYGANFYPFLLKDKNKFNVSLYEPEIFSKYLDLETMKIYKSSFSNEPLN